MKILKNLALLAALLLMPLNTCAQVVINEIMAQNSSIVKDPDYGDYADWVELYNMGSQDIDLGGFLVSDEPKNPAKYLLPERTVIKAGGYLVLWCDGQGKGLHTSFKLSADGEEFCLYSPNGEVVDTASFGAQMMDVSYGRLANAGDGWFFFTEPTPGFRNADKGYKGKANQPMILTPGGFFSGYATVSITNDLGGKVHYTLDGSVPDESSPIYKGAITFYQTTVLRARIIQEGMIPGNVMTETYFIDENFSDHHLPVVSLVTNSDNFWDPQTGIYMQDFKPDWEIPVNIELFLNNGSDRSVFNEAAGVKINGLYSWQLPQKMLGVYFKKKYGASKLEYKLFQDDERASFDNFALRASGNDWSNTLMRDGVVQQAARKGGMNIDLMAFRPCIVFVNGEFLGVHNIREKVDKDYVKRHYDIGGADIDMVEGGDETEEGTLEAWDEFFDLAKSIDLTDDSNFKLISDAIDVENFTDYIISQSYSANTSLSHNTMVWKTVGSGKWRWILMDCDRGFFQFDNSDINYVVKRDYWPLKQMLTNAAYRQYFCKRMADQLYTTFNAEEVCRQIDMHESDIAPVMEQQVDRWLGTTSSYGDAMPSVQYWRDEVEELRDFARGRVSILLDDLSNYGAKKPAVLTLSSLPEESCTLTFNGHNLAATSWFGLYPKEMDITLTAHDRAGHAFKGWAQSEITDLIPRGSVWKYLDNGSDQGQAWVQPSFNDSSWKSGEAPLGYKFDDIKTTVSYGSSSSKKHMTTYFRRHFNLDSKEGVRSVKIQLRREDAAAVYLNGRKVVNSNLPLEGLNYKSKALATMDVSSGYNYLVYEVSPDDLHEGDNVIAAEVHQNSSSSSDLTFDLQLQVEVLRDDAPVLGTDRTLKLRLKEDTGVCALYEGTGEHVLPDSINSDMVLYKKYSPYIVSRDVVVGADARLTIEPGVTLNFSPKANMIVHGAVVAEGTPADSILFRLNPDYGTEEGWGALCFINTGKKASSVSYAEFRNGSRGPEEYFCVAVVSGFNTTLNLDHLRITDTYANPIAVRYSDIRVTNSILHSSITGDLVNVKYGKGYVADTEFIGNDQEDTDAIDYDGVENGVIKGVVIHDFLGDNSDAIDIGEQAKNVLIDSVLIFDITDKGVSVGQRSSAKVTNSTFIQTNLGLGVKDSCYAEVGNCTFYAVRTPIASYEKVVGRAGGNVHVTSSVFANSFVQDVLCDDKSWVSVDGSLSDSSELPYGKENCLAAPEYVAPSIYDLSSDLQLLSHIGSHYMPLKPDVQPIISEICYRPDDSGSLTEYIVLTNPGDEVIDLSGYNFTSGITFTFPAGIELPAGESVVLAKDPTMLDDIENLFMWDSGKLADEGETLELSTPHGVVVDQVRYLPSAPWPVINSNGENSIILKNLLKANHIASNWQQKPSADEDALPGVSQLLQDIKHVYDLQGRPASVKSHKGILIIGGKKVARAAF